MNNEQISIIITIKVQLSVLKCGKKAINEKPEQENFVLNFIASIFLIVLF